MFTTLLHSRSLTALVLAMVISYLAVLSVVFLEIEQIAFLGFNLPIWLGKFLFILLLPPLALLLNELIAKLELFEGSYHVTVIASVFFTCIFIGFANLDYLLLLLILSSFAVLVQQGLDPEKSVINAFNFGMLSALGYLIYANQLLLLISSLVFFTIIGSMAVRPFLALLMGFGAINFLVFSFMDLSGLSENPAEIWLQFAKVKFELLLSSKFLALGIFGILLFALSFFVSLKGKSNVVQHRLIMALFAIMAFICIAAVLALSQKEAALSLLVLPLAIFSLSWFKKVENRWLKDLYYLLLFGFLIASVS